MKESQCLYQIIHRNAVVLLTLQILTAQLQIIAALIPTLQILAEVMMNPTKTGTISGRFSRCTTGSSSTRNAVVLLTLQILTVQIPTLQIFTALIPTLQILAEVMMNPSKTGSVSGRFSRSTTGSSSTSSTSGNGTFRPYESRRDDIVTVYDINVESLANWIMKNTLSDSVFQTDENSLRRSLTEIKTF